VELLYFTKENRECKFLKADFEGYPIPGKHEQIQRLLSPFCVEGAYDAE